MAGKHPYLSGSGPLYQIIEQLRKSFPAGGLTADTLKKLGLASGNESYVINILRFIDVIDEEGKKSEVAAKVFNQHDDEKFKEGFEGLVQKAYSDLFSLHGDDTWTLDQDSLIQYFRTSDETSSIVGKRQASVFQALSALSGHAEVPIAKGSATAKSKATTKKARTKKHLPNKNETEAEATGSSQTREVGLTVRIEINLPADGDRETYDHIFKSIRENLIDAE